MPPSGVLQVTHTLTTVGLPGELRRSFNQRHIIGFSTGALAIHHRLISRPSGHELCWVAPMVQGHQARSRPVHPAPTTPPKHSSRWQVSWLAGRCHQPPSREFPVAPAWGSSLTVAGAAPALRELAPASLFTSHEGGPSAATLSAGVRGVNRYGQKSSRINPTRAVGSGRPGKGTKCITMPVENHIAYKRERNAEPAMKQNERSYGARLHHLNDAATS